MAGHLFHSVAPWKSNKLDEKESDFTPGRIGHVFFFPEKSYLLLKDKPKNWSIKTNGGFLKKIIEGAEETEESEEAEKAETSEGSLVG